MRYYWSIIFLAIFIAPICSEGASSRSFLYQQTYLQASKEAWQSGAPWAVVTVASLLNEANRDLQAGPYSVTQSFHLIPVSGTTPNDFISTGAYWWRNPNTPDGLPYISRDGHGNPDSAGSFTQLAPMAEAVHRLGLAYFFTGDEAYAQHAANLAREFFITPETRMNPNTEFGGIIPGVSNGSFVVAGIGNSFRRLYEGLGLIEASFSWTEEDKHAMQGWSKNLLLWMKFSPKCRKESRSPGNHGTNYDMVAALLSIYSDDMEGAKRYIRHYISRIPLQFAPDGIQPNEMLRANNFLYSSYNLQVAADIADLGKNFGMDLWNINTAAGAGIRRSINFLAPYMTGNADWIFWTNETFPPQPGRYHDLLQRAALGLNNPELLQAADSLGYGNNTESLVNLTHPAIILIHNQQ